jgi:hypothetical protein
MSEESVAIAALDRRVEKVEDGIEPIPTLLASKHTHGNKLQEHTGKLAEIEAKLTANSTTIAVNSSEVEGLRGTVSTGFSDLRNVIIVRAEAEAEARARDHELALGAAADRRALGMKVLGLVATALTIAGGGGGALYAMSDDPPERPPVVAPVVP